MIDPERPQVPGAVEKCKAAGIRVIMVTVIIPRQLRPLVEKWVSFGVIPNEV